MIVVLLLVSARAGKSYTQIHQERIFIVVEHFLTLPIANEVKTFVRDLAELGPRIDKDGINWTFRASGHAKSLIFIYLRAT